MRFTNKKAVFFDLDHTLWDFEKNSALALHTVIPKYTTGINVDDFVAQYSPTNVKYWKLFRDGAITQQQLRYGRLKDVFDVLGYSITDDVITEISSEYVTMLPLNNHLYTGAVEILDYLKPRYSLHIITNGFNNVQSGKLKNANIAHYFDTITDSDLAGCKKPDPAIFEYALTAAGAQKCDSVMIGDCIEADVQGALNCGLDAIYFNEHNKEAHPDIRQVSRLLELKNLL